jgi:hypothetical protein
MDNLYMPTASVGMAPKRELIGTEAETGFLDKRDKSLENKEFG